MELLYTAFLNLARKRSQMILTVCGIAIGVFSVLIISAIGTAGQGVINEELERLGFDCITISAAQQELNTMDSEAIATVGAMPEVELAAPLNTNFGRAAMREYMGDVLICGVDQNVGKIIQLDLKSGRLLRESDISAGTNCCVIDEKMAYDYYKRQNIVGKQLELTVNQVTEVFTIVGVVDGDASALKNLAGDYVPSFVYIPYTTHQVFCRKSALDQLFIKVRSDYDPGEAGDKIVNFLNLSAGYRNLYQYENLAVQKERLNSILGVVTMVLSAIGGISLLVSGLSIMTIMMVSVRDRTREIGIKKAVGAKVRHILGEFMVESILITLIGSILGIISSQVVMLTVQLVAKINFSISCATMLWTLLFSLVIGAIFGVYPAKLASQLRPVDALRYE